MLSGRYCVYEQKFAHERTRWDAIRASATPVKYMVSWNDLDWSGDTALFYPQRTFYENLVRTGATDCGPMPGNRF